MIITILYFVNHFDLWEKYVFNFLSFKVVVFIFITTAFQKTKNFYKLGSFNHWFSIWKSFLDTKKKIIQVPLQKLAFYLDYKMIVEVDCAFVTVSSGGLFKSMLLKYYSNKNLPTLTNTSEKSFSINTTVFGDLFRLRKLPESKYYKWIKEMYNLQCISVTKLCIRCV